MPNVYILYTGGTIGCVSSNGQPLAPMPGPQFAALVGSMPGLALHQVSGYPGLTYTVGWTPQPLDSSNMTPADWVAIAQQLAQNYASYDGFVVLHGTDTMAYTASALSFLLAGLSKPVVLTGSQLPLSFSLNDALPNLVGAIVLAGTPQISEVCIYFDSLLLRGNRSAKVNANQFAAFGSPNYPPLATLGTELTLNTSLLLPPPSYSISLSNPANLQALQQQLSQWAQRIATFSVTVLMLYPGIQASTVQAMLQGTVPPVQGVVLEAFGEGNAPSSPPFLAVLSQANQGGVVLIDNTQVLTGEVNNTAYQTGSSLAQAGAISAYDMTPEASLTKLVYLFGTGMSATEVAAQMQVDLRGEITPESSTATLVLPVS
jgi:L-asparaginase